jgi:ABC-type branched-subunit amino acid transport system substrate-binding protein
MAATVYGNWQTVKEIRYQAGTNLYLVSFNGTPLTNETDSLGNACGSYAFAVVKASADGVATTDQTVDRMVQSLEIARATGLRVRLWVHHCSTAGTATTYPKAYLVWTVE